MVKNNNTKTTLPSGFGKYCSLVSLMEEKRWNFSYKNMSLFITN